MTSPPRSSAVYIAGVGSSPLPSTGSSAKHVITASVSAVTKALLDAGVTFDDVSQGVTSVEGKEVGGNASLAFKVFDPAGIAVDEVDRGLELQSAFQRVRDRGAQCVLVIASRKSTAIALLLVSESFLWRHPYLKDSATVVSESDSTEPSTESQSQTDLQGICRIVWALRGWVKTQSSSVGRHTFTFRETRSDYVFELSRADGEAIPPMREVEHRQDGKHRLGYNPATKTKEISQEDFEAVRAQGIDRRDFDDRYQFERKGGDRAVLSKL